MPYGDLAFGCLTCRPHQDDSVNKTCCVCYSIHYYRPMIIGRPWWLHLQYMYMPRYSMRVDMLRIAMYELKRDVILT